MSPGQHQILRFKTHAKLEPRLVAHVAGINRPATARPVEGPIDPIIPLCDPIDLAAVRETINRTRPTGRGRRPGEAIDVVIAGPPSYGTAEQWTDESEMAWASESFAWLKELIGPESVIVTAALHRDESSPHLQAVIVPVHEGRLGWTKLKEAAWTRVRSAGAESTTAYGCFQDDYQRVVGHRFGLGRGERGSSRTHEPSDRVLALEARARVAEEHEKFARERETHARAHAERLEEANTVAAEEHARITQEAIDATEAAGRARSERKRDEVAAKAARQQRDDDLALGLGETWMFGTAAQRRHGKDVREKYEAEMKKLRKERNTAKAERDTAKADLEKFATTEAELNDERKAHQATKTQLADARNQLRKMPGKVHEAWFSGLSSGLRVVGALLERALPERVRTTDFWKPLLSDFQKGNLDGIRELMSIPDRQQLVQDVLVGADAETVEGIRGALHRDEDPEEEVSPEVVAPSPSRAPGAAQGRLRPREGGMER